jgi:hypothetical protein
MRRSASQSHVFAAAFEAAFVRDWSVRSAGAATRIETVTLVSGRLMELSQVHDEGRAGDRLPNAFDRAAIP